MILFFKPTTTSIYAVKAKQNLSKPDLDKLKWLFNEAHQIDKAVLDGFFVGPRREMITPWSTNAVEITQNMHMEGIERIEEFFSVKNADAPHDKMLQIIYQNLNQEIFTIDKKPEPIIFIDDIATYNQQEGLALSSDEIEYLNQVSKNIGRHLTDSEVFGFSQVNSEHCRHKIFNGTFIIDGKEKPETLFQLIKKTSQINHNKIVSAYKDNVAFIKGPVIKQFAPVTQDKADFFQLREIESVISLKAETHNFPTTVEPFNGAATGSGGEIRDRMAGGQGSIPMAGTAVYMTSYPRLDNDRQWEKFTEPRNWLYQTPEEILIKASNGASDFGNKFGQPLICGSLLTFEFNHNAFNQSKKLGFDKVIMMAGGIGFGKSSDSQKAIPQTGDKIIVMGGDNYRIGMGGGAVSSVATGEYNSGIELNAVQRSNPEMQKRVYNAIRAMVESEENPIISVHDHGAGGHLNALSELVEHNGGVIHLDKLPVGDPTLSSKEIIGNESQERMGLVIHEKDLPLLERIAERERAPMYVAGEITDDMNFCFVDEQGNKPIDLKLEHLFGKSPKTILTDETINELLTDVVYDENLLTHYIENVLQIEAVACKDWLTNKVDRSVTGKIAMQQTAGEIQLPLNNLGIVALDYDGVKGIATSIGHAPVAGLLNPATGSILSIAEALTNIVWAPIDGGLSGISLSANWMWPCKNEGEDARLYKAVEAASKFAIDLGLNIPTGKDSLSMTQKYPDGEKVYSPGTVIISACGEVSNIRKAVTPVLKDVANTQIIYIDFSGDLFHLGGSSFAQTLGQIGKTAPTIKNPEYFKKCFNAIQYFVENDKILAGHDISAGGLITTLLEMTFATSKHGILFNLQGFYEKDKIKILFSEKPGVVIQVEDSSFVRNYLKENAIDFALVGHLKTDRKFSITSFERTYQLEIDHLRDLWFRTSFLLDRHQSSEKMALKRFWNYKKQILQFTFPENFTGQIEKEFTTFGKRPKAAIIREKGVNGDREMAYSMFLAGFDVKDVHITDLTSGRETLEDISFIAFVGGFSNSDVLGSAKGWAGAILFNDKAKQAIDNFYARVDTLSLGVCNGCQVMVELGLIYPDHQIKPAMFHNESRKYESAFINVDIVENNSVMLESLAGSRLGIWVAHGEGKFNFPYQEEKYHIPVKFSYNEYPGNPNGSDFSTAGICSDDGRHLAMMPHLERSIFPWQWAHYPVERKQEETTPWFEAFVNARKWIEAKANVK